ncbi:MAG: histidine kinase [Deferribacteres bacterium]|nr:histidine kinase [Deferribacteres bacterium]
MATTTSSSGPKSLKVWVGIFLLGTLIGLANFNRFTTEELAQNNKPPIAKIFINEMTGAYTILLLLPPLFAFFRKFSLRRGQLVKLIPLHLLASVAFGASHTLLMFLSRKLIYWLAFGINYNYGRLDIRFLMEYNHQIITYWVMYGIFFAVNAFRDIQRQKLQASQLQEQLTAARLQALQMQLNPHFLFNTLNMISSTMYDSIEKADAMLTRLSDLLRATLGSAQTVQHTVARELELIDLYIEIMKARFDDKLQFSLDIDAQTQSALVPSFILQPLVENAILHTMQAVQKAEIGIVSQRDGERLVLIVTDNGPGIDAGQQANNDKGIGLANTRERLEKMYGSAAHLSMQNIEDGGLKVEIKLPFVVEKT